MYSEAAVVIARKLAGSLETPSPLEGVVSYGRRKHNGRNES